ASIVYALYCTSYTTYLHSFPTRRSSDLSSGDSCAYAAQTRSRVGTVTDSVECASVHPTGGRAEPFIIQFTIHPRPVAGEVHCPKAYRTQHGAWYCADQFILFISLYYIATLVAQRTLLG